jgi:hypothetical protein
MAISFIGSHVGTHAATSTQTINFSSLLNDVGGTPTVLENDVVVVTYVHSMATTATRTLAQCTPSGYTNAHASIIQQNDSNAVSMAVSYKIMTATPDTSVGIPAAAATTNGVGYAIYVFRGVDITNVLDVTTTTANAGNTGVANAPSITPTTAGSWIVVCGGAAVAAGAVFTNPVGLSATTNHFRSATITTTTNDANVGVGLKTDWSSGAFDPAVFGGSTSTNTGSWGAASLVLRGADRTLTPSLFTNTQTFHGPTVTASNTLTPGLLTNTQTFHAATVLAIYGLTPSLVTNTQTFPAPTVTTTYSLTVPLLTNTQTFHASAVSATYTLSPDLFTNNQIFYGHVVEGEGGDVSLLPSLLENLSIFYSPTITAIPKRVYSEFALGLPFIRYRRRH